MFKRLIVLFVAVAAAAAAALLGLTGSGPAAPAAAFSAAPAGSERIYLPIIARAPGQIWGLATDGGAKTAGLPISLRFYNGSTWSTLATVQTDAAGVYQFLNMPGLAGGQKYQIVFDNTSQNANRLAWWGSSEITSYAHGSALQVSAFDVANVALVTPAHDGHVALPSAFRWVRRAASPSDSYALRLYDTTDFVPLFVSPYVGYTETYTVTTLPPGFTAGTPYTWDVILRGPDGGTGVSRQSRTVSMSLGIHGWVKQGGVAAAGIPLQLRFFNGTAWSTVLTATTAADGSFVFANAPSLGASQKYYVRYQNNTQVAGRLFQWSTRTLTSYTAGSGVHIGSFDIADLALVSPAASSTIGLPYLFQWTARHASSDDGYILEIYDPSDYNPRWLSPLMGYTSSYTLYGLAPSLNTNTTYAWDVVISAPDGGSGVSRIARLVRFADRGSAFDAASADWPFEEELRLRGGDELEGED
jgi:5-hydroxyisourate hydrolase-like protein (transthyretin family)